MGKLITAWLPSYIGFLLVQVKQKEENKMEGENERQRPNFGVSHQY